MQRLAAGDLVTTIAGDLGYESVSAFIAMFRRMLGTTPARYFDEPMVPASERTDTEILHSSKDDATIPERDDDAYDQNIVLIGRDRTPRRGGQS